MLFCKSYVVDVKSQLTLHKYFKPDKIKFEYPDLQLQVLLPELNVVDTSSQAIEHS
jgi:hypothetical protein